MDANEILKHAPELLKGGAALAGALKFTDIIRAMLGPATAEIAERFKDNIRVYRYGRQLECLKKAEQMAKEAGFTPKAVPIKLLFPLLEGASLEEDETLHSMWAALLANASNPSHQQMLRLGFLELLRRISKDSALLINAVWTPIRTRFEDEQRMGNIPNPLNPTWIGEWVDVLRLYTDLGLTTIGDERTVADLAPLERCRAAMNHLRQFWSCVDELLREDILVCKVERERNEGLEMTEQYYLTLFGFEFLTACSCPDDTNRDSTLSLRG
jgi:hypothetical protein